MEQASLIDEHPVGNGFDQADLFEMLIRPLDVSGVWPKPRRLGCGHRHETGDIGLGDLLDLGNAMPEEGCSRPFRNPEEVEQGDVVGVGRIEVRGALHGQKVGRQGRDHRKARFHKFEAIDVERAGDELRRALAAFGHIMIGIRIGGYDVAPHPGIEAGVLGRERRQRLGDIANPLRIAAEAIDDDNRCLPDAEPAKLNPHRLARH